LFRHDQSAAQRHVAAHVRDAERGDGRVGLLFSAPAVTETAFAPSAASSGRSRWATGPTARTHVMGRRCGALAVNAQVRRLSLVN
jgi:hypothetical protein